jgi:hypothetical protein
MSSPISFPELYKAGFDDFIIPSHETAPFTTIQNRAKVTRSLKAIAGVERVMVRGVNRLQNEFGPNGEQVWEADNKDSRIRFVGTVSSLSNTSGSQIVLAQNAFSEIAFYGTGINFLYKVDNAGRDLKQSIDGGAETDVSEMGSTILSARNYATNQVIPLYSNLTLGWHVLRLRNNSANDDFIYGFEILNQRTDLAVYQGSGIAQGALNGLSSLATSSFTDGVTGTRGARVVKYIDNGTLKSAVQAVDASAAYLASANHTNEEVVRRINFREFGANRADDFSTLAGVVSDRAFTLDDGTTTLVGNDVNIVSTSGLDGVIVNSNSSGFATLTFVGTGLDLFLVNNTTSAINNTSNAFEFYVDGVLVGNLPVQASDTHLKIFKVCSGLPYGTHTVRVFRNAPNNWSIGLHDFIIYQPKKPSIPAGALEVADYNVVASFVPSLTSTNFVPSQGVVRKSSLREATYVGTWASPVLDTSLFSHGFNVGGNTANNFVTYTFFGTGFDFRTVITNAFSYNWTVLVDGLALNAGTNIGSSSSLITTGSTGLSMSAAGVVSGAATGSGTNPALIRVTGLSLGLHTVRITLNSGYYLWNDGFDIITPIHINQPSLKTGSLSLKSATKYSPEKVLSNAGPDLSKAKAWVVFDGVNQIIYSSYNVQAVLRTATGVFYVYFEKPFKIRGSSPYGLVGSVLVSSSQAETQNSGFTNSYCLIETSGSGGVKTNAGLITMVAYGELIDE